MLRVSIRTKIFLTETMAVELGRADAHWAFVQTEARRSSVPDLIRHTVAAAQTSMFSAETAKFRQAIRDDLTRGEAKISLADFQADNSMRQRMIMNVAMTAMDQIIVSTELAVDRARREMIMMAGIIAIALLVTVSGLAITHFSVIRPLSALRTTMSKLGQGDLSVHVTGSDRRDEIGAMSLSIQGFKESLIRHETRTFGE